MIEEEHDKKLVRNLHNGDVFSFDEVYKKYNKKIYSFTYSYLKNKEDAEDVVEEVFLILWRKRDDLKDYCSIDSYLFKITFNIIRKRFHKLAKERKHLESYRDTIELEDDSTNADIEYENLLELAETAITALPSRQKTVYKLNMQEGFTCKEIAEKMGISHRTAENHLHRAKTDLKKALLDKRLISFLFICLFIL